MLPVDVYVPLLLASLAIVGVLVQFALDRLKIYPNEWNRFGNNIMKTVGALLLILLAAETLVEETRATLQTVLLLVLAALSLLCWVVFQLLSRPEDLQRSDIRTAEWIGSSVMAILISGAILIALIPEHGETALWWAVLFVLAV